MYFSITIENHPEDENQQSPYEKQFNCDTTVKQILHEFGLDSALIVGVNNEIIKPQTTLKQIQFQNDCGFQKQKLNLKLMPSWSGFPNNRKFKYYLKDSDKIYMEWNKAQKDKTLSVFLDEKKGKQIIHKKKIVDLQLRFMDIQKTKDDEIELSVLDKEIKEDEILVIIYSDEITEQDGLQNFQSEETDYFSYVDEEFKLKEKIIYYQIQKRSDTIESIIKKLKSQKIFALQSIKGVLDQKKTFGYYFKFDLQCKLLVIQNKLEVKNVLIENRTILVNVFKDGQLILRKLFDKYDKINQVEKRLSKEIQGQVDFIMPDKEIIDSAQDLEDLGEDEINLEVIIRQFDYDRMEDILNKALKQVQELKQKQKNIEIQQDSLNPIYKKLIQKDQSIDRLQQIIEQQRYKNYQKHQILQIQTIKNAVSCEVNLTSN